MVVINYSNLFDRLKVLIKYFNILESRQVAVVSTDLPLPYIKNQILSPYETQDITAELETLETDFEAAIIAEGLLKLSVISWFEAALAGTAKELGVHSTTAADVLAALADAMVHDSESLNAREMIVNALDVDTDSTIKPHTSNVGTGRLVYTFTRPGLSPSEIANVEVIQCLCTAAATPKQENFQLSGEQNNSRDSHLGQGSGLGPFVTALGTSITNGNFETWSGGPLAANSWTATLGAWGTEIVQTAAVVYEGTYSVVTDYTQGDWKITTSLPITLQPATMYTMGLWLRKQTGATGTLRFGLSNGDAKTDFVAGCGASVDLAGLSTTFAFRFITFKTPTTIDSTWTLGISADTPAVADIYFDYAQFGIMTAFNNMYLAICSGADAFGVNDKFGFGSDNTGFEITESAPGIIQKFISRCFNTQLPSATGGSETIADPA